MIILVEPSSWEPGRMHYFWKFPLYAVVTTKDMPLLPWVADSDMLRWRSFRSWQDDETAPDARGRWWGVKLRVAAAALCVCSVWELGRWGLCLIIWFLPLKKWTKKPLSFYEGGSLEKVRSCPSKMRTSIYQLCGQNQGTMLPVSRRELEYGDVCGHAIWRLGSLEAKDSWISSKKRRCLHSFQRRMNQVLNRRQNWSFPGRCTVNGRTK